MIKSWSSFVSGVAVSATLFGAAAILTDGPQAEAKNHVVGQYYEGRGVLVLSGGRIKSGAKLGPYLEAMSKAVANSPLEPVTFVNKVEEFEGDWNYNGFLSVEWAPNMQVVQDFLKSKDYRAVIKERKDRIDIDFTIGLPDSQAD